MAKKKMTIEDLAVMVKRGFDETASKTELEAVKKDINFLKITSATKHDLHELRKELTDSINSVAVEMRDIKIAMGPLLKVVAALEFDVKNLNARVVRLERKAGLAK